MVLVAGVLLALLLARIADVPGLEKPPRWLQLPIDRWIGQIFDGFLALSVGGVTVVDLFRGLTATFGVPVAFAEAVLLKGSAGLGLPPLPWVTVALLFAALGALSLRPGLAVLGFLGMAYLATFGMWDLSMQTLALVLVAAPTAAVPGFVLGIAMEARTHLERRITPILDFLQSVPQIAYLVPAVVLLGLGDVTAVLATAVFATPAMARCVALGLHGIPREVIEAGQMTGATPWQMLLKVRLPAALPSVLVGFNQVVMMSLAMVVIASLIGASGLGHEVLIQLDRLSLGRALEVGMGIVVLAVTLDRIGSGIANRRAGMARTWVQRNGVRLLLAAAAVAAVLQFAQVTGFDAFKGILTTAPLWDGLISGIVSEFSDQLETFRNAFLVWFALPIRQALLWLPWPGLILAAAAGGYWLGGPRLMLLALVTLGVPAIGGLWVPAISTVYMVLAALLICVAIGVPVAVLVSRNARLSQAALLVCDVMQTLPSFIYLVPFVMLFRVGDVSAIAATVAFAIVPMVRYTVFGLRQLPVAPIEAATVVGCTPMQRLVKVELPLALPHVLLGVNQTILFALFALSVTGLVGARDLSQTIYRALANLDAGKGLLAGTCIALLAMLADRCIRAIIARQRPAGRAI